MNAVNLKTEYLRDPMGIDVERPRLFWNCQHGRRQTAFQVVCKDGKGKPLWDSGKREGDSMRVRYGGSPLKSRQCVLWQVRIWDEAGKAGPWSETATFEMGLLRREDWSARWITGDYRPRKKRRYPVDLFRREIPVDRGLVSARLYITACGLYEARCNGTKAGMFCLAPGLTDYRRRVQYQTYDVTRLLHPGANELTVQLADGWYRGSVGAWGIRNAYGTETKFLAQLELEYGDGSRCVVGSDGAWQWSNDGPLRFADNKDGEVVEAWRVPSYRGKARVTKHPVIPCASNNVPVTEHERFTPDISVAPNGKLLLDFHQNIAGYLDFQVNAHKGDRLFFRFGELLDKDGNLTLDNIQCKKKNGTATPLQQIEYRCKEGLNRYKTTFAVFGFQYAEVETELPLSPEDVKVVAVYSDLEETGKFACSDPLLERFYEITKWSTKGNSLDIPTDCPTRERHGWTGDAQIFFQTAGYLFDYAAFSEKYLRDVFDWQKKSGRLPQIAPYGGVDFYMWPMNGSVGWSDLGILLPYRFWKLYGDREILRRWYEPMKRYARFMMKRCGTWGGPFAARVKLKGKGKRYLVNAGQSYGEWLEPADVHPMDWKDMASPHPEVSTAYTAYVLGLMGEIAQEMGEEQEASLYWKYAEGCKVAYQELVELPKYSLDTDRQAQLVRPLAFGLLNNRQAEFARQRLLQAMEHYRWRVGTGFLSTPLILNVLASIDIEAAYRLLENKQMPGWLYMVEKGATTVWENWEGTQAKNPASLNHYSKGAVCQWLFETMCGIRVAGENRFLLHPQPGGHFDWAEASYRSIYGEVGCKWEKSESQIVYTIHIPDNCSAEVQIPGLSACVVDAGEYQYVVSLNHGR